MSLQGYLLYIEAWYRFQDNLLCLTLQDVIFFLMHMEICMCEFLGSMLMYVNVCVPLFRDSY